MARNSLTVTEAAGKLAWYLCDGEGLTVDDAAQIVAGCSGAGEWAALDKRQRKAYKDRARRMLQRLSRQLPIYDRAHIIEGESVMIWQAIECSEAG